MQAWSKISKMPAPAIIKMQEDLLYKMLNEELALRHPFYKAMFSEKGINPAEIKSLGDLAKIPFTEKADILPREENLMHPKQFVLEPPAEGEKKEKKKGFSLFGKKDTGPDPEEYKFHTLYFTAGRTNKPVPIEYTGHDLDNLKEAGMRAFDVLELVRDDTLINAFTFAPNVFFWQMFYSTIGIGSTALQTGGGKVLGLEKILKALDSMEAPALVISPGYGRFALHTLKHFGFSAANLEKIILGIDYTPLAAVDKMKALMKEVGAKGDQVKRTYFLSEAKSGWAECAPGFGYHTNPDHILIEIVDPETGAVLGEGEPGEIVVTHLDTRGTVLLRYRTGDLASGGITTEPCPNCRRTVPRIMGDIERKDHFYQLKGSEGTVSLNGNLLRKVMFSRDDVLLWYAEIISEGSVDSLKVLFKGVSGTDEDAAKTALESDLSSEFKVSVKAEICTLDAVANKIGLERNITEQNIYDTRSS
jgi:phenylacetate-coenzyme A ligase PaaK-like adenylate-forming protein